MRINWSILSAKTKNGTFSMATTRFFHGNTILYLNFCQFLMLLEYLNITVEEHSLTTGHYWDQHKKCLFLFWKYWTWSEYWPTLCSCVLTVWWPMLWYLTLLSIWSPFCLPSLPSWRKSQTTDREMWTCWSGLSVWCCTIQFTSLISVG